MCVESVTTAVMKNAEESAQLLAKLALNGTEDPSKALEMAAAQRDEGMARLTMTPGLVRNGACPTITNDDEGGFRLPMSGNLTKSLALERNKVFPIVEACCRLP